jgi:hypothetical protein
MGKLALLGISFFVAYWVCYVMLWARTSRLRGSVPTSSALPDPSSLYLGTAAIGYLWSPRHREAKDAKLTRLVFATRLTQLLVPIGAVLIFMN